MFVLAEDAKSVGKNRESKQYSSSSGEDAMPGRNLREHANRLLSFAAAARTRGYRQLAELYAAAAARYFDRAVEVEKSAARPEAVHNERLP
jgi:hypothetical protein